MKAEQLTGKIETRIFETTKSYDDVRAFCYEAKEFGFHSIQVFPCMLSLGKEIITGTNVIMNAVISYPHGGFSIEQKALEAKNAVENGAREVEVVINAREVKSGNYDYIEKEMKAVKEAVGADIKVKFNIEIESLSDEEAQQVCRTALKAGIDVIVTSTGLYHTLDENKNDVPLVTSTREVRILKEILGSQINIQAEGNISSLQTVEELLAAGADYISTEYAFKIMREAQI